jgi:ATPase subunit of ABC transporter with duplicated ATPase domains
MELLSGGQRKLVGLARCLLAEPDILLLDEPTNHLDIPAIEWLEERLAAHAAGILLISHDRAFLKRLSRRTFWLDRGRLLQLDDGYAGFESWSEGVLEAEAAEAAAVAQAAAAARVLAEVEAEREAAQEAAAQAPAVPSVEEAATPRLSEEVEWYLLARLAAQRAVSLGGSLPLLLDDALVDLAPADVEHVLGRLERMAAAVQVIVVSEDPVVAAWAGMAGADRAAVVRPEASSTL